LKVIFIIAVIVGVGIATSYKNYDARLLEASADWVQKDWDKQSETAGKALSDARTEEEKAYAYYWLGVAENRKKNYRAAADYQLKALSILPKYAAAHASLSNAYTFLNEHEKAFDHAQKCIEYEPTYAWCYHAMLNHYWVTGDEQKALANAKKATELDPGNRELKQIYQHISSSLSNK
jgi:tetratricopeptide (TPR) repeat protein